MKRREGAGGGVWSSAALERLLEVADPGVWGPEDVQTGVSVLRSTNFLDDGRLDLSKLSLRSLPKASQATKLLQPGDILLERSGGSPRQPVGRVCFFTGDRQPHSFGNFCQRLRANRKTCDSRYLFWYLFHVHATGGTLRFQKQTTGIRNLDYSSYLRQSVPLPPLSEQRRIVEILDQADRFRRLRAEADAKADRILPALFIKMFGDPATNPMGWPVVPFERVFKDITSRCPKIQRNEYGPTGRFPIIDQGKDLVAGFTDDDTLCHRPSEPVVVFGDHTRIVKYVDFAFVAGADGSRVFAIEDNFVPEFAAQLLQLQPIPDLGYSRHMRVLRGLTFIAPPRDMQASFAKSYSDCLKLRPLSSTAALELGRLWEAVSSRALGGSLTASWREAHMKELLQEMEQQARALANG